jgi:hypothetical protein
MIPNCQKHPWFSRIKEAALKTSLVTVLVTIVLSLGVWMFFYVTTPGTPLTLPETTVVVGACAPVVVLGKFLWARLRKKERLL